MTHEINYPPAITYFIAHTGLIYSYGVVNINECMTTGLKEIETFDNEEDYLSRLAELNINIDEIENYDDYDNIGG